MSRNLTGAGHLFLIPDSIAIQMPHTCVVRGIWVMMQHINNPDPEAGGIIG